MATYKRPGINMVATTTSRLETTVEVLTAAVAKLASNLDGSFQGNRQAKDTDVKECSRCGVQWVSSWLFFWVMVVLCTTTVSGNMSPELQRLNYGVVFEPYAQLHLSKEAWIHTFEIQLPEETNLIEISGCNKDSKTCALVNDVLVELNQIRMDTESMINSTIESIERLVPEQGQVVKSRSRRAILGFIGKLSKSIFGTATVEDVEMLAKHINKLNKLTNNIVSSVQQHDEELSSFIQTSDARMSNLMNGIKENEMAIQHIHTQIFESFKNLEQSFSTMSVLLAKQIEKSRQLESVFRELLQGIYDLVKGKLSPHLIPATTMISTISDIQDILHSKFNGFHLIFQNPNDIYKHVPCIYSRQGAKLYISVKFPISPFPEPMSLFKIVSFPVPVNESSAHATQLLDLPEMFAITSNMQYYTSFLNSELQQCSGSHIMMCKFNRVLTPITSNSCVLALFKNDKDLIKDHCDFRFRQDHLDSNLVALTHSEVLVYNIEVLELDCFEGKRMIPACKFCIINIPCGCAVGTASVYLPPRLSVCHQNTTSTIYPINLALLQQFFNNSLLKDIQGNSVFENPLVVDVPTFNLYNHSMTNVMADDSKAHLSLEKMAEAAKNDAVVFRTLTEPLLSGSIKINEPWPTSDDVLLYVTTGVATFCLIALLFTAMKLRKVLIILSVLQKAQVKQVNASTLPSFVYKDHKYVTTNQSYFWESLTMEHYILSVGILTLSLLVILTVYLCKFKTRKTMLIAEITNGKHCVRVPLMCLSMCPNHWKVKAPQNINCISIQGLWSPILSFDWDNFGVENTISEKRKSVDKTLQVSMFTARKIRQILSTTYCIYFYILHDEFLLPIQ